MTKPLIAVMSCNRPEFSSRVPSQRATWAVEDSRADIRFFYGAGRLKPARSDEVVLDAPDDYDGFALKVRAMFAWAREKGYQYVFKTDDDVYVSLDRLLASGYNGFDYVGRLRGSSGKKPAAYCSGLGYWMSKKAIDAVLAEDWDGDTAEDRHVGNVLYRAGVIPRADYRYAVSHSVKNSITCREGPRRGNELIACGEYDDRMMIKTHRAFKYEFSLEPPPRANGPLSNVAVMVKTFLRDGYLYKAIAGIESTMPEMKIVVVDDGPGNKHKNSFYSELMDRGHAVSVLPFDAGFGAKANAALPFLDRQYVLVGSDDFNFMDKNARIGILRMLSVLEHDPSIDVASGRVNGRPYESLLAFERGEVMEREGYRESRRLGDIVYHLCDLTVNYSLIRRSILGETKIHWDGGEVKIGGGEHGAFFVDLARAGHKVAYVEGANINEFAPNPFCYDISYPQYRGRASRAVGRPCLKRRGIDRWQLTSGIWEEA